MSYTYTSETEGMLTVFFDGQVTMHKAGTATVTVSTTGTANAGAAEASYTVTVLKADAGLTLAEQTFSYTGSAITGYQTATVTDAGNGAVAVDTEKITYQFFADETCSQSIDVPRAAGTYYLKATLADDPNYQNDTGHGQGHHPPERCAGGLRRFLQRGIRRRAHDLHDLFEDVTVTGINGAVDYKVTFATTESNTAPETGWADSLSVQHVADSTSATRYYWCKVEADNYQPVIKQIWVSITPKNIALEPEVTREKTYDGNADAAVSVAETIAGAGGEQIAVTAAASYDNKNAGETKPSPSPTP